MRRLLTDLPVEVLVDNVLPLVELSDIGSLAATSRALAAVSADDTFWKRKCDDDFNFTSSETARTSGWKVLYKGLFRPRIFVWGDRGSGRLGVIDAPRSMGGGVPYPIEVKIPGKRIVSLAAGGMSFHALDSKGLMYVWGTLNGEGTAFNLDGFSEDSKVARVPHQLILPNPIRTISCGRLHSLALDSKSQLLTFCNWGRPFRLVSPLVDCHAPETTPIQAESGWFFCSVLTQSGDVLVYWHASGTMGRVFSDKMSEMNNEGSTKAEVIGGHEIPCVIWEMRQDPFHLPPIPELPVLQRNGLTDDEQSEPTKLIKIAALDNNLIGLTNKGHVLKFYGLDNETVYTSGRWEYLPKFSDVKEIRNRVVFNSSSSPSVSGSESPHTMRITHITAHFTSFVAYSTGTNSIILMGTADTGPISDATILPALQNRSVINVLLGDYHFGALTSDGKLLTWGSYSNGALGFGDPRTLPAGAPGGYATEAELRQVQQQRFLREPPRVDEPTEVHFNHDGQSGKKFVFAATAAGWHTGALVLSLEPEKDELDTETRTMPGHFPEHDAEPIPPPSGIGIFDPGTIAAYPPIGGGFRGGRVYRIGYAGRGRGAHSEGGRGRGL